MAAEQYAVSPYQEYANMKIVRHGLTIGIERAGRDFFVSVKASGKLTREDYETITPMIDSALSTVNKTVSSMGGRY
jgi:hypothetical protein